MKNHRDTLRAQRVEQVRTHHPRDYFSLLDYCALACLIAANKLSPLRNLLPSVIAPALSKKFIALHSWHITIDIAHDLRAQLEITNKLADSQTQVAYTQELALVTGEWRRYAMLYLKPYFISLIALPESTVHKLLFEGFGLAPMKHRIDMGFGKIFEINVQDGIFEKTPSTKDALSVDITHLTPSLI